MLREHPLRQNGRQGNSLHCQPGDWHANELSISPTSWFAVAASLLEFQFRRCNCCSDFTPPPLDSIWWDDMSHLMLWHVALQSSCSLLEKFLQWKKTSWNFMKSTWLHRRGDECKCVSATPSKLLQLSMVLLYSMQEPLELQGKRPGANCHDRPGHTVAKDQNRPVLCPPDPSSDSLSHTT
ncbi:hypothetical protein STEG23_025541, partial [Scotinomys teguina]